MERLRRGAPFLCAVVSFSLETSRIRNNPVATPDRTPLESPHSRDIQLRGLSTTSEEPMRFRAALIVGALLVVATAGTAFGQGFQGGLRGSIKDAGGVIPGVEVTLTNEQTNVKRSTVTNERGEYNFANVDPGNYDIK